MPTPFYTGFLSMPITNDAGRNIGGENALTGIAQSTGGKCLLPGLTLWTWRSSEILRDLADAISDRLLSEERSAHEGPLPQNRNTSFTTGIASSYAHWLLWGDAASSVDAANGLLQNQSS